MQQQAASVLDVSLVEVANVDRNWLICAENRICSAGESRSDDGATKLPFK